MNHRRTQRTKSLIESVYILDITGKTVKIQNSNTKRIDTSNLPNGQYWIQINTESHSEVKSFTKM